MGVHTTIEILAQVNTGTGKYIAQYDRRHEVATVPQNYS